MGGGSVLERKGALDHRAHCPGRHKAQGHLELAARCANRAADLKPAPVDCRHVHFNGRSGHLADQHDTAAGCHRAPHLVEYRAAHGIDSNVDAASARRRAHALSEAAVDRHNDGIGTGLFKRADFGLRTVVATTKAPTACAIWTAWKPSPPAPEISTRSPGCTRPVSHTALKAVPTGQPTWRRR